MIWSRSVAQKKSAMPRVRRKSKPSKKATVMPDGCIIPPQVKEEALNQFKFDAGNEHEADHIAKYVEWQCQKDAERVTYLEKLRTENVFGADYDCWNVRTDKKRYWVITNPTNLYSQDLFPSLDYTLSFHIGLDGPRSVPAQGGERGTSWRPARRGFSALGAGGGSSGCEQGIRRSAGCGDAMS